MFVTSTFPNQISKGMGSSIASASAISWKATDSTIKRNLQRQSKVWDRFAEGYSKQPIPDEGSYGKKLEMTRKYFHKDSTTVVEFGCGTGSTSILHAPFVKRILATDLSPKMIDIAKSRAAEAGVTNVEFRVASVEQLEIPKSSQDVVLGLNILHLLPDHEGAMKKVHTWLKPGGYFVTSTICTRDLGTAKKLFLHLVLPVGQFFGLLPFVQKFTKNELKECFSRTGFTIVEEYQPRKGAAVFIIGRRMADMRISDEKT